MLSGTFNKTLFAGLTLALVAVFILPYLLVVIVFMIFLVLAYQSKRSFVLSSIIIALLVFTRTEFQDLRNIITGLSLVTLFFLFFKEYALNFRRYPRLPAEYKLLILFLILTVSFSTLANGISALSSFVLTRMLIFFALCYALFSFGNKNIYRYINSLIIAQLIIGISILYDFIKGGLSFFLKNGVLARFTGIHDNPNFIGLIAIITTCYLIALLFSEKIKYKKIRMLFSFLLLINALIILITDSRAAIISILISSSIIIYLLNKKILKRLIFIFTGIFILLLFLPYVQEFLLLLLRSDEINAREYFWSSGIEMFQDHWLWGVGPERFPDHFYTYLPSFAKTMFTEIGAFDIGKIPSPHNYFLLMSSENGIAGLISSFLIFGIYFNIVIKNLKMSKMIDKEYYIISVALLGIGIGTFIRAFFEVSGVFSYGYILQDLPFWLSYTILFILYAKLKEVRMLEGNIENGAYN
jgi:O-antigen ligase